MGRQYQPGHRQRGAGTVSISKGDILYQGVLCKEWQRTPMQLLHEFCQAKKRRHAFYTRARAKEVSKFRMCCVLPDIKDSKKDMRFCTEQEYETQDEAKHCAALLALKHVEPLRPFERKLPDPYRTLWLTFDAKEDVNELRSGVHKEKKKMRANDDEKELKNEELMENKGREILRSNQENINHVETCKMPMSLTMERKFASFKAFEAAKLVQTQERNRKVRMRENRERANLLPQVMMSTACREMIEGVLRKLSENKQNKFGMRIQEEEERRDTELKHFEGIEFEKMAMKRLKRIGFTPIQIQEALQSSLRDEVGGNECIDIRMSAIFDWLCLNVPEEELPKKFNPAGTQLDVILSNQSSKLAEVGSTIVLVQRLMSFGYDHHDAVMVTNEFLYENPAISIEELQTPSLMTVFALVEKLFLHVRIYYALEEFDRAVEAVCGEQELLNQRQDEIFALEAIYDDKLKTVMPMSGSNAQLLTFGVTDDLRLHIFLPSTSKYPFELPLLALTSTEAKHQPHLLVACGEALKSCVHSAGNPIIYDIVVAIDTYFQDPKRLSTRPSRIQLLRKVVAVKKEVGTASSSRTETQADDNRMSRKKKNYLRDNHSKTLKHCSQKRVDGKALRRISENLLKLRKLKDDQSGFQQMLAARAKLPASKEEAQVIRCVQNNQVVLICGATGCGKTTQIPQFILDEYINRGAGGECNIVCTQPRRIAAIGVATRVAQERCEAIADIVGYQIRMDAKKSSNTRLLFCTTGVLLRRLLNDRRVSDVSHIIVDEVHERNVDTDFLLSILRDLLPQRPDLRVILMSATMNSELFVKYFSSITQAPCPVLDIPGYTYPVECLFLEDILDQTHYDVPKYLLKDKKVKKDGNEDENADKVSCKVTSEEIVARVDDSLIHYDLIVHLVRFLVLEKAQSARSANGAILIFLPGTAEIKQLVEILSHDKGGLSSKLWTLSLHGSLTGAEQAMVFKSAAAGKTKVIVSTNIAETSITINDIAAVIDSGKVKEMIYDNRARRSQLLDCWASQAACEQRKGRAGRVQAGTCYRLFSRKRFAAMNAQLSAEIHRVSLEQLCLQIKKLDFGSIKGFFSKAIEPPAEDAIDAAIQELVDIAAFRVVSSFLKENVYSGIQHIHDEEVVLTPLGNHLAMLPLDARIGKFLVYGSILRCIEPVAIMAACISSRNPFLMSMSNPEMRAKQDALKRELSGSWKSDHLLLLKLVERYAPLRGQKVKRDFCRDIGLSYDTMESILDLKQQYLQQASNIGFYDLRSTDNLNENANAPRIIKAALCAGLYANVVQVVYPEQKYFQAAHGTVEEERNAKHIRYLVRSTTEAGQRERVFLHPSSCNFTETKYDSPWLLYTELVQTSKVFVRESTMVNPYALLLFGGNLEVLHEKNMLTLDGFVRFHAVARIGVLLKSIRQHLDELLLEKLADPSVDIAESELVTAISHLLKSEGMYAGT